MYNANVKTTTNMKKLFIALSFIAVSLSMTSCDYLKKLHEKATDVTDPDSQNTETAAHTNPNEIHIYSNAYDGYVNVRQQPSAKSAILGKLKNGQEHLVKLGTEGKWTKVKWQNTVGYVNSSIVGHTPWKPVYLDIDGDSIEGVYGDDYKDEVYFIFSNGKFAFFHEAMASADYSCDLYYGTWKFEGTDIIFTTKYITDEGKSRGASHIGAEVRLPVTSDKIGNYYTRPLDEGVYSFGHDDYITLQDFRKWRQKANKLVSLK